MTDTITIFQPPYCETCENWTRLRGVTGYHGMPGGNCELLRGWADYPDGTAQRPFITYANFGCNRHIPKENSHE